MCLSRGGRSERRDSELPELLFTVQAKLCFGMDNDWGRGQVREDVGRAAGGKIECGSGGAQREQKGRGQTPSAEAACLAFSLPWLFDVVGGW